MKTKLSGENKYPKKKKIKKKVLSLKRKPIVAYGTITIVAIAGILGGILIFGENQKRTDATFLCGLDDAPDSIDPLINPGPRYVNLIIIDQVAEGLFAYDQNKTNTPIVPNLALNGTWSSDHLNFTCSLRDNVMFHDGTPFNAAAVQWNFERIYRFIEIMPYNHIWAWYYSYLNSEGKPIINHTVRLNDYTIRFVLNQPYAPIKDLLAFWQSYILSPTSTPENESIDIRTGKLIGTGPFILDSCDVDIYGFSVKTDMHANPDYWGGKPSINKVSFLKLDSLERMERMISGKLSYAMGVSDDSILDTYKNTPGITVIPKTRLAFFYLGMDNQKINVTIRKAISYAFNYTRYIEKFWGGHAERARSPIPKKMRYSNWEDFDVPYYNISMARQILKDANWLGTLNLTANSNITIGNEWELLANSSTPLAIYNFSSYCSGTDFVGNLVIDDLKQIGVKVNLIKLGPVDYWERMSKGELEFFAIGWGAAMLDPVEVINPCYSCKLDGTEGNFYHFNDSEVQQWMEEALEEFNETERNQLYFNIQQKLIEELNPVVWLVFPIIYDIWDSNVRGIPLDGIQFRLILKNIYLI